MVSSPVSKFSRLYKAQLMPRFFRLEQSGHILGIVAALPDWKMLILCKNHRVGWDRPYSSKCVNLLHDYSKSIKQADELLEQLSVEVPAHFIFHDLQGLKRRHRLLVGPPGHQCIIRVYDVADPGERINLFTR